MLHCRAGEGEERPQPSASDRSLTGATCSELVYATPPPIHHHHNDSLAIDDAHRRPLPANAFEPFYATQEAVRSRIKQLFTDQSSSAPSSTSSQGGPGIVSALLRALCHANRLDPASTSAGDDVEGAGIANVRSSTTGHHATSSGDGMTGMETRIMIVSNTPGQGSEASGAGGGGYVGLMNAVFAAQKRVSRGEQEAKGVSLTLVVENTDRCIRLATRAS